MARMNPKTYTMKIDVDSKDAIKNTKKFTKESERLAVATERVNNAIAAMGDISTLMAQLEELQKIASKTASAIKSIRRPWWKFWGSI